MATPNLPADWGVAGGAYDSPEEKINWFNQNGVTEDQLLAAGVGQGDIDWMKSQGYDGGSAVAQFKKAGAEAPAGWGIVGGAYDSPEEKIAYLNQIGATPAQLEAAGVSKADIAWMEGQGYVGGRTGTTMPKTTPTPAPPPVTTTPTPAPPPVTATTTTIPASQSTLSPNFSPYVYKMLAKGEAAADLPYQPFTGQRFAGPAPLQEQSFQGLSNLQLPSEFRAGSQLAALAGLSAGNLGNYAPGRFANFYQTPQEYSPETMSTGLGDVKSVRDYMNPYQQNVIDIQAREARRQADIGRNAEQARLAQAGAYGGSRQAIMEAERQRNLGTQIGDIQEKGLQAAYDRAQAQRVAESQLGLEAQKSTEQSRQYGYGQGMNAAQLGAQYGLEGARQTEASRQFGANLGLQSLNPMLSAASTLGGLGQQQFGAGIQGLNAQLAGGATQQALAQQPLDFGYQQFQESVKFPYQQATYMQSLLGGLPLQAAPYSSNQGQSGMFSGLQGALAGLALYNAFNPTATPK
jgi:hypothetical protein